AIQYGLEGIAGMPAPRNVGRHTLSTVFVAELNEAKQGHTVYYMKRFMEHTENMALNILEALKDGVNVKMLLMHPADDALVHRFNELPKIYGELPTFKQKLLWDATGIVELWDKQRLE